MCRMHVNYGNMIKEILWVYVSKHYYDAIAIWDYFSDLDSDTYATNVTNCLLDLAKKYIPSKNVTVRLQTHLGCIMIFAGQ